MEKAWDLRVRTKSFAVAVVRKSEVIPDTESGRIMRRQVVRSATSVAANFRAAKLARSKAEFASKLQISLEEADETCFWIEMLIECRLVEESDVRELLSEAKELTAILMSSLKTARGL